MSETPPRMPPGRLLLFERDPAKRHYFQKYILGILWCGLSEEEKHYRLLEAVKQRRAEAREGVTEE